MPARSLLGEGKTPLHFATPPTHDPLSRIQRLGGLFVMHPPVWNMLEKMATIDKEEIYTYVITLLLVFFPFSIAPVAAIVLPSTWWPRAGQVRRNSDGQGEQRSSYSSSPQSWIVVGVLRCGQQK